MAQIMYVMIIIMGSSCGDVDGFMGDTKINTVCITFREECNSYKYNFNNNSTDQLPNFFLFLFYFL